MGTRDGLQRRYGNLRIAAVCSVVTIDRSKIAECLALRWALDLIRVCEFRMVVLETDCLQAVKEFHKPNPASLIFNLLGDTKNTYRCLNGFCLNFSHRSSNLVAHTITKTLSSSYVTIWEGDFPDLIVQLAQNDVDPSGDELIKFTFSQKKNQNY